MEAKKQGAGEEDLSMEEILQSIRRIIADDSEEGKALVGANASATPKLDSASDILELTDMIEEDGSITNLKEVAKEPVIELAKSVDVLSNIDAALAPAPEPAPVPASEVKPEPKPEPEIKPDVKAEPIPTKTPDEPEKMPDETLDALLSKTAQEAALSSLSKLNIPEEKPVYKPITPSPEFRSGMTVEDMVGEMIRPMLKEWLDANLPIIVERIVEKEVARITKR